MTLKAVRQTSTAAALKAERERDMAQAVRDYENDHRARLANMTRLRALRAEKERAESEHNARLANMARLRAFSLKNKRADSKIASTPRSLRKKEAATESR